jgi:hypothetical protein
MEDFVGCIGCGGIYTAIAVYEMGKAIENPSAPMNVMVPLGSEKMWPESDTET